MSFADRLQTVASYMEAVDSAAKELDCKCYLVGGSIRQMLGGRSPHDLDFVVDRENVAEKLANLIADKLPGASKPDRVNDIPTLEVRHQKVILQFADPVIDTSIKTDSIYAELSTALKQDILRRDFTINTLLLSVHLREADDIIDPTAIGRQDIEKRRLRTPLEPEDTFSDDPLRMLRAVRFVTTEGFTMKADLAAAITSFAPKIQEIPAERVQQEFTQIVKANQPSIGVALMKKLALLHFLFPEIEHLADVHQKSEHYEEDILSHSLKVMDYTPAMIRVRLAALFHDIGKSQTKKEEGDKTLFHGHQHVGAGQAEATLKRMRYSKKLCNDVARLVDMHMITYSPDWSDIAVRRLVHKAGELLDDLLLIYRSDILARTEPYNDLSEFNHLMERIKLLDLDEIVDAKSPLSGEEVMEMMGITAGPKVGEIQEDIEQAIVDGKIAPTAEDARDYLENEIKPRRT